jgi:DNA-binding response OmpR family regulator/signal transduction histidine kinase
MTELTAPILIVEDSETQALQLRFLLEEGGWEVVRASTAESALEELNRRRPALIIADYHLPGMRGDELCRRVRMNIDTRDIPILILTAEEADGSERAGLDSGADGYVSKSVAPEIFMVRVRAVLRAACERSSALVSGESRFHRARLLAIDDSPTYLSYLAETLSAEGYDVAKAANGEEGLGLIALQAFDCILVDLVMPDLDGIEVCRRINALGRTQDRAMSVVILTSCESKEDMTRGLEAGADDFVGKSSDITVLKARIRALLRRKFFQEENQRIRERGAKLDQLLQAVTVAANRSSSIEQAARVCLERICSHTGWPIGHLYLCPNHSSEELISTLWHLEENERMEAFRVATDLCHFTAGDGLPGRVLACGKPEWIVDLSGKDLFRRTLAAAEAGLLSGFAFPIFVTDTVIGVLEFFSVHIAQPDRELLAMTGHIGSQLGHVITRQRAEEDLRHAKVAAESANRAKSEFLTTVSHEMRTPLNAILGTTGLLSDTSLDEKQRDCVRILQIAGTNLFGLINDILDLSKVESGHLELESIGFDLRRLLEGTIEMLGPRAHGRGLLLALEILPDVPEGLVGDANRLAQILSNFVGNALKFTERGSITVRVGPELGAGAGWLRFSVVDTGIGIASEKMEMIFERFTQADSSTTRKYGGTGLGLAINKGLVQLMGGQIGCTSEPGKGSTFFFTAPFEIRKEVESLPSVQPAPIPILAASLPEREPGTRILIVEDNEENVWLMEAYLKGCGFELDFAENGKIAVERFINGNPNLVFMDLQMPVMDGLEATRRIREWEARTHTGPIPILAITAHAAAEGARSSLEAGCNEHLTKPINKAKLLEAISRHVDRIENTVH